MSEVLRVARGEVVDAENRVALAEQAIGEVRTKKSGGAGDKYSLGQEIDAPEFSSWARDGFTTATETLREL